MRSPACISNKSMWCDVCLVVITAASFRIYPFHSEESIPRRPRAKPLAIELSLVYTSSVVSYRHLCCRIPCVAQPHGGPIPRCHHRPPPRAPYADLAVECSILCTRSVPPGQTRGFFMHLVRFGHVPCPFGHVPCPFGHARCPFGHARCPRTSCMSKTDKHAFTISCSYSSSLLLSLRFHPRSPHIHNGRFSDSFATFHSFQIALPPWSVVQPFQTAKSIQVEIQRRIAKGL